MIGTLAGFTVFLFFLFFAVNLLVGLYATSVVTSTAYEGARTVAGHTIDHRDPDATRSAQRQAEATMRDLLGGYGRNVTFDWTGSDDTQVRLRVVAQPPDLAFGRLGAIGTGRIDRTVAVRIEELR